MKFTKGKQQNLRFYTLTGNKIIIQILFPLKSFSLKLKIRYAITLDLFFLRIYILRVSKKECLIADYKKVKR